MYTNYLYFQNRCGIASERHPASTYADVEGDGDATEGAGTRSGDGALGGFTPASSEVLLPVGWLTGALEGRVGGKSNNVVAGVATGCAAAAGITGEPPPRGVVFPGICKGAAGDGGNTLQEACGGAVSVRGGGC